MPFPVELEGHANALGLCWVEVVRGPSWARLEVCSVRWGSIPWCTPVPTCPVVPEPSAQPCLLVLLMLSHKEAEDSCELV